MKRKISYILIYISVIVLVICSVNIATWLADNNKVKSEINEINEVVKPAEKEDSKETVIVDPDSLYVKDRFLSVNFDELTKMNKETVGWLFVNNTNINYAVVQGKNNSYYLNHTFMKKSNGGGWVFMDYSNKVDEDKNVVIYGHERKNGAMFGTLKNALNRSWFDNKDNHTIKFSSKDHNYLYEIFSVYIVPTTDDYIQTKFKNNKEFNTFVNMLKKRSKFNFDVNVSGDDKIITLSTCHGDEEKMVVHAKLIKSE